MKTLLRRARNRLRELRGKGSAPAIARRRVPSGTPLVYEPVFDDPEAFASHYWRAVWYLAAMPEDAGEVVFITSFEPTLPKTPPEYLDQRLPDRAALVADSMRFLRAGSAEAEAALASPHISLVWDAAHEQRTGLKTYQLDHDTVPGAGSHYLFVSAQWESGADADLAECRRRFNALPIGREDGVANLFGTGPGLAQADGFDFSDGLSIACNSMVANRELMDRLQPPVIVATDPIFHAGCSSYAADFRSALVDAMRRYNSVYFCPWRDWRVHVSHLPDDLKSRVIGVPMDHAEVPNLDLSADFRVTVTRNVLTLMLLPLACTWRSHIRIAGCDGRPLDQNNYFWTHDAKSQIVERMDDIKLAHPAFFAIDYDEYYISHIETLETWLSAGEAAGKSFENLTPSHIPALIARTPA